MSHTTLVTNISIWLTDLKLVTFFDLGEEVQPKNTKNRPWNGKSRGCFFGLFCLFDHLIFQIMIHKCLPSLPSKTG